MFNVDEKVYGALTASSIITSTVGANIAHNGNWNGGTYPAITFMEVDNSPKLSADDTTAVDGIEMQVTIFYKDGNMTALVKEIEKAMLSVGFRPPRGYETNNGECKCKVMLFNIIGKGE